MPKECLGFTQRKFKSFSPQKKHKKSAELLRSWIESSSEESLHHYTSIQEWELWPSLDSTHFETVADRYHWHLQEAGIHLSEHRLLPPVRQGDRLQGTPALPIAIYLDHLRSAHNVGSIIRTTEAFSAGKVYFSPGMVAPNHKKVGDTAMGSTQWVEMEQNVPIEKLPRPLLVLETAENARSIYDFSFPECFTLALGNEEYGCSQEILAKADYILHIPLFGRKNSLNVANAYAIVIAEVVRQIRKTPRGSHA